MKDIRLGRKEAVSLELSTTANLFIRSRDGRSLLELAQDYQHAEIERVIQCALNNAWRVAQSAGYTAYAEALLEVGAQGEVDTPRRVGKECSSTVAPSPALEHKPDEATNKKEKLVPVAAPRWTSFELNKALVQEAFKNDINSVKCLIKAGADVNAIYENKVALMGFSGHNNVAAMALLLAKGADINCVSGPRRRTALMYAAYNGCDEAVSFLLRKGAKFDIEDGKRRTALDIATLQGHKRCVQLLHNAALERSHQLDELWPVPSGLDIPLPSLPFYWQDEAAEGQGVEGKHAPAIGLC